MATPLQLSLGRAQLAIGKQFAVGGDQWAVYDRINGTLITTTTAYVREHEDDEFGLVAPLTSSGIAAGRTLVSLGDPSLYFIVSQQPSMERDIIEAPLYAPRIVATARMTIQNSLGGTLAGMVDLPIELLTDRDRIGDATLQIEAIARVERRSLPAALPAIIKTYRAAVTMADGTVVTYTVLRAAPDDPFGGIYRFELRRTTEGIYG